ncbi:hypothetical protein, partial [Mobiluncus mulieris]|uniref:hypothetical protein n=1 Tax=Mobiluncus mulieris TaxID=2052 RepID=UPI00242BC0E8
MESLEISRKTWGLQKARHARDANKGSSICVPWGGHVLFLSVALFWVIPKGSDAPIVEISVKYWGGLVSGFVGFGLDSVLFFVYA